MSRGRQTTRIVSDWVTVATAFFAVIVNVQVPAVVGVPAMRAPPVVVVNDIPGGSVPDRETVGTGQPVVVIVKDEDCPRVNETLDGLVIFGPSRTVSVKF